MSTTAVVKPPAIPPAPLTAHNSVLIRLAERFQVDPATFMNTVKSTLMPSSKDAPDISNEQIGAFLLVADQYNLNPFTKQIYAFPSKGGIVPIVSIDGWYQIMNSHPMFNGIQYEDRFTDEGELLSITAKIHRKDREHPVEITEYLVECKRNTEPWTKWPARMLRHKATIQAARAAFGLAGIYDPDEGERVVEATLVTSAKPANGQTRTAQLEASLADPPVDPPAATEPTDDAREPGSDG